MSVSPPTYPALQTLRLRDGRQLAYAEYGDPDGPAVVHCHGQPGSRLEGRLAETAARRLSVRLITLDRVTRRRVHKMAQQLFTGQSLRLAAVGRVDRLRIAEESLRL